MSESTARAHVYAVINGVNNKGICYDYGRWAADWSGFLTLFKTTVDSTDQIRGWMVRLRSMAQEYVSFGEKIKRTYLWQIIGIMGLDDSAATQKTFATLAEDVVGALDADGDLHGASYHDCGAASLDVFEERLFGSVLCHYAEINLVLSELQ